MATIASVPAERRLLGIGLRACSATLFAVMAMLAKAASARGATLVEMIFYRNLWAIPVITVWIMLGPGWSAIRTRQPMAHVTRSAIGFTTMALTFAAIALLPLGEATTLTYAAPILATILSAIVLGESIGWHRWLAVVTGFAGVLLVVRPGGTDLPAIGLLCGIGAAVGQSGVMVTLRQITRSEETEAIVFWFAVSSTVVAGLGMPIFARNHDALTFALLIGAGLAAGGGQLAMTAALRFAPVATVAPFDYLQILWATLFGWLIFGADLLPTTLAGAALIVASGLYTAYREQRRGHAPTQALAPPEG